MKREDGTCGGTQSAYQNQSKQIEEVGRRQEARNTRNSMEKLEEKHKRDRRWSGNGSGKTKKIREDTDYGSREGHWIATWAIFSSVGVSSIVESIRDLCAADVDGRKGRAKHIILQHKKDTVREELDRCRWNAVASHQTLCVSRAGACCGHGEGYRLDRHQMRRRLSVEKGGSDEEKWTRE